MPDLTTELITSIPSTAFGSNNIVLGSASNIAAMGSICAANMGVFRNRIINGDMRINQSAAGLLTFNSTASLAYAVDRWVTYISIASGSTTVQQTALTSADTPFNQGFKQSIKYSVVTGMSYTWFIPNQTIESYNISDLNWNGSGVGYNATLSFWFKAKVTGNYNYVLRCPILQYQSYINQFNYSVADVWQYITLTVPPPTSTGAQWNANNNMAGMQVEIAGIQKNSVGSVAGWTVPSATSTNAFETLTGYVDWPATTGNYIQFTGVQLEKGSLATPFEFRPYPIEMQLCQRYFYKWGGSDLGATNGLLGYGFNDYTASRGETVFYYPVPMRAPPSSITASNISSFLVLAAAGGTASSSSATSLYTDMTTSTSTRIVMPCSGTVAQYQLTRIVGLNSNASMYFSAEL